MIDGDAAIDRALGDRSLLSVDEQLERGSLRHQTQLMLDPVTGRLFQRVESGAPGDFLVHLIDAESGAILDAWDAIEHASPGGGTGVKGDRKSLLGDTGSTDDLSKNVSGVWRMQTSDGRLATLDAKGNYYYSSTAFMTDNAKAGWANDNDWTAAYQGAAVDAQYYARVTDYFFRDPASVGGAGFDLNADCAASGYGPLRTVVHFDETPFDGFGYDNAFFDGFTGDLVFGDGDGVTTSGLAGAQDIVSHEFAHRATECRAPLEYSRQSGALNEAFSDIMATAIEWELNEPTSSNCRRQATQSACPDWWIGEDSILGGTNFGFRNTANPESAGQPGHWDDRSTGSYDNYGVHINSTIPTHAFYLMVNGGRNARCAGPSDALADCDVIVPSIPKADATQIMFAAWGTLPNPTPSSAAGSHMFCNARDATVLQAEILFPGSNAHRAAADLAWAAVGRGAADCHPDLSTDDFAIELDERSLALPPGGSGAMQLTLTRGTAVTGQVDFTVSGGSVATMSLTPAQSIEPGPGDFASLTVDVPPDMADGVYPIVVAASDGINTRHASAVLVIDGSAPLVDLAAVQLGGTGQISVSGAVPVRVTWSASDAASGLASSALDVSATGADGTWATVATGGNSGTSSIDLGGASQWFRVTATDALGNSATSAPSGPWTIGRFQEGAANYKGTWSAFPAAQDWGSVRYTSTPGAIAKFSFTGTDVAWISTRGRSAAKPRSTWTAP